LALGHDLFEIGGSRGDDSDIGLWSFGAPDRLKSPLLQHAQEGGLEGERQLCDLVNKEGASGSPLELAEKLGLQKCFRDGGTIHGREGALPSRPVIVDDPGTQSLPCTALARDEDSCLRMQHARSMRCKTSRILGLWPTIGMLTIASSQTTCHSCMPCPCQIASDKGRRAWRCGREAATPWLEQ